MLKSVVFVPKNPVSGDNVLKDLTFSSLQTIQLMQNIDNNKKIQIK